MTQRQLASLLCRILGLYLALQSLGSLGGLVQIVLLGTTSGGGFAAGGTWGGWGGAGVAALLLGAVGPGLVKGGFGIILFIFAEGFAAFIVRDDQTPNSSYSVSARELGHVAYSIFGLFLVCQSMPRLAEFALASFVGPVGLSSSSIGRIMGMASVGESQLGSVVSGVVQLGFGIVLMMRYRLANLSGPQQPTTSAYEGQVEHL